MVLVTLLMAAALLLAACAAPTPDDPGRAAWRVHHQAGIAALDRGDLPAAERQLRAALAVADTLARGEENRLGTLGQLARLYKYRNEATRADSVNGLILAARESSLGRDHPQLIRLLETLAGSAKAQNDYARAEFLYGRVLEIQEEDLDFPGFAATLLTLAATCRAQDQFARADSLDRRALGLKLFTQAHDRFLASHFAKAEAGYESALSVQEKYLHRDHPDLARTYTYLGLLQSNQGRHAAAEKSYRRALTIRERRLGPEHPDLVSALQDLAAAMKKMERHDEADALVARAARIRGQVRSR